jgi:uncharacterized membrane protein
MSEQPSNKTSTGIQQNFAGLLCYIVGWITGIVFLLLEKENKFVRFHAVQSIVVFGAYTILVIVFGRVPVIGWIITWLLGITAFIVWLILMYKAYQGKTVKFPIAGNIAEQQSKPNVQK